MWKKYKEIILYLIFGVLTTVINIIVFEGSMRILLLPLMMANIVAWILSVLFAYVTNKIFVFESRTEQTMKEMISFYAARILTLVIETGMLQVMIGMLGMQSTFSKIVSNLVVIVLNYIFSKLFVFKKN